MHAYGVSVDHERGHSNFAKGACTRGMEKRWRRSECKVALAGRPTDRPACRTFIGRACGRGKQFRRVHLELGKLKLTPQDVEHEKIRDASESHKVLAYLAPQATRPNKERRCLRRTQIASLHFSVHITCWNLLEKATDVHVSAVEDCACDIWPRLCAWLDMVMWQEATLCDAHKLHSLWCEHFIAFIW